MSGISLIWRYSPVIMADEHDHTGAPLSGPVPEIDVDELAGLLGHSSIDLVDVREEDEFVEARVPGGRNVPLSSLGQGPPPLMAGGPTYVICKSGGRSMKASEFFRQMGIEAVNVAGGTMAWMESGRPVESGAVQPGTGRSENMESGRE